MALLLIDLTHKYFDKKKPVLILKEETGWDLARTIGRKKKGSILTKIPPRI